MNYIINKLLRFIPKEVSKPVGRWKIENCHIKMNHKIDLSNEDHCGPCGEYALKKIELKNDKTVLESSLKRYKENLV